VIKNSNKETILHIIVNIIKGIMTKKLDGKKSNKRKENKIKLKKDETL